MTKDLLSASFKTLKQDCNILLQIQDEIMTSALSYLLWGFPLSCSYQCTERIIFHDEVPELPEEQIIEHLQKVQEFLSQPVDRMFVSDAVLSTIQSHSIDKLMVDNVLIDLANSLQNIYDIVLKEAFAEGYICYELECMKKERVALIPFLVSP
jgi:hypothetical protein